MVQDPVGTFRTGHLISLSQFDGVISLHLSERYEKRLREAGCERIEDFLSKDILPYWHADLLPEIVCLQQSSQPCEDCAISGDVHISSQDGCF